MYIGESMCRVRETRLKYFLSPYIVNELKEKNESNKELHTMVVPIIVKQYENYPRSLILKRNPF